MTTSNIPMLLSKKSQEGIIQFHRQCYNLLNQTWNIREMFRQIDLSYIRESDWTSANRRAELANKYGDSDKFKNITVPVVKPLVESAVTYQTSVFLTGEPLFGVVSTPEFEDEALQLESIISEQSIRGGWVRHLMMFFRDGFKYNLSAIECSWDRLVTPSFDTDVSFSATKGKPKEIQWEGNVIKRLDPYNLFFDARVPITEVHSKGEFAGYTELMSRIQLKDFIAKLPDKMVENIIPAFESGLGSTVGGFSTGGIESYYIPQINPNALINKNPRASTDWMAWVGASETAGKINIQYKNLYEVTVIYGRILPSDFGIKVPSANTPQVWKFIIVNHQVIIYAERQTNAHGFIPIIFGQPYEDGLTYQTKSLADDAKDFQSVSSAMMNSLIASRRRAISDRVIYDPSRISEHHINSDSPTAKIPVRPSAYGKSVHDSVYAFPYRDDQAPVLIQEIQNLVSFANMLTGRNQAKQGQFVKGNKTLHEYSDVMAYANGRDQMTAMLYEAQCFTPLKQILKTNILQFQGGTSVYNASKKQSIAIDPVKLRKAILEFKVTDGLLPTDKLISSDALQGALQLFMSAPQIAAQYNVAPMISYLLKTQGADIAAFEKSPQQLAYEQAVQQWQQLAAVAIKENKPFNIPQPIPSQYGYTPEPPAPNSPLITQSS